MGLLAIATVTIVSQSGKMIANKSSYALRRRDISLFAVRTSARAPSPAINLPCRFRAFSILSFLLLIENGLQIIGRDIDGLFYSLPYIRFFFFFFFSFSVTGWLHSFREAIGLNRRSSGKGSLASNSILTQEILTIDNIATAIA